MARFSKPKIETSLPDLSGIRDGGGGWPLSLDRVQNWAWQKQVFTPEEMDSIIAIGERKTLDKGTTYGKHSDKIRNSHVRFLYPNELTTWVFQKLTDAINITNQRHFGFDLFSLEQGLQFTRYTAPGEHYDWHVDRGWNSALRKLSVSVQLSNPDDYEGGDLELKFGGKSDRVTRERGMVTFFPSWTLHRVRPVTKGTRYSLVAWVSGPPFK